MAALAGLALAAPAAQADFSSSRSATRTPACSRQPRFQALKIKKVRYLVPWDFYKDAGQAAEVAAYMNAARAANQDVLVAFTARARLLQRPLLALEGLPRAQRERVQVGVPALRPPVQLGQDVLGLE